MALELNKSPEGQTNGGVFSLPPGFDSKKFAAEWVEEGQVPFKRQRQNLPQTGYTADGWEAYKVEGAKTAHTVVGSDKKRYILMVRPRAIQDQVNALFGNVSKNQMRREQKGETVAGAALQDPGMLTEQHLRSAIGEGALVGEEGDTAPNPIGVTTTAVIST